MNASLLKMGVHFHANSINPARLFFVGGLSVMSQPFALSDLHVRKNCREGGVLRAAGIDAEFDPIRTLPHMTYPQLGEPLAVLRTLDAVIILSAAEPVPHGFHLCRYGGGGPVRIAVVSDYAAQMLELLVFVLHRAFEPVFAVQVHDDTALVKTVVSAGEIGLDYEGEEFFLCLHLENGGVVVAEMVVCPLPKVGARLSGDLNFLVPNHILPGRPGPL